MDAGITYTIPISEAHGYPLKVVGGKTKNSSLCSKAGFRIPEGFAITTDAYFEFVRNNGIDKLIEMELSRKSELDLRWEEIWDAALRIRLAFTRGTLSPVIEEAILKTLSHWPEGTKFAVRSSSPEEDAKDFSFAGVHESYVNVSGTKQVLDKIKLVWASLWSDRALLYKKESGLDPATSSMAVLVQKMEHREVSGLTFTADPSNRNQDYMIVEAIQGTLNLLVDNKKKPERIRISKSTEEYEEMGNPLSGKTLTKESIQVLYENALRLETLFQEPVDIEWTGLLDEFTVLQVRPITVFKKDDNQLRQWYLTLTPSGEKLLDLADRVEKNLIPELIQEGQHLAALEPQGLDREEFLRELKIRGESHDRWEQVYRDDFIPFAHGIRHFGSFYNDLMKPVDPYEFIHLLKNQDMLARRRNRRMNSLADYLRTDSILRGQIQQWMDLGYEGKLLLEKMEEACKTNNPPKEFAQLFLDFLEHEMDLSYDQVHLKEVPETSLGVILALAKDAEPKEDPEDAENERDLSDAFLKKAREEFLLEEAKNWLRIGRVSWKLRDDDNLLLAKIESQLQYFLMAGLERLYEEKRIDRIPEKYDSKDWRKVYTGVAEKISIPLPRDPEKALGKTQRKTKARQLTGQPSSPGIYSGVARVIRSIRDFKGTAKGEVLVFDAVEPQMTFIISLAGAIVERRGGMLVHSSIIAREMNIPAVNGVPKATSLIQTGDFITVNGDLGIVVIGKPEFEIELGR